MATGTAWNIERDSALARAGSTVYSENATDCLGRRSLHIVKRVSHEKGAGFGTASTREIVARSFALGFEGRVHNAASWSSHFFHLYMGMIPYDRSINPILHYWGLCGEEAVQNFELIKECLELNEPLSEEEEGYLKTLKQMIAHTKGMSLKEITDRDVIAEGESAIAQLNEKEVSFLREEFIPSILRILEKNPAERHPDTTSLTSVEMMMSDEGIARWKQAIEQKLEFKQFKKLEHLHSYMTPEQLSCMSRVMEIREKALKKA